MYAVRLYAAAAGLHAVCFLLALILAVCIARNVSAMSASVYPDRASAAELLA